MCPGTVKRTETWQLILTFKDKMLNFLKLLQKKLKIYKNFTKFKQITLDGPPRPESMVDF